MKKKIPDTFYYYFSYALIPVFGLLQTKILTSVLSNNDFGKIQLITPLIDWLVLIVGLGAPQYVIRFYSRDGIEIYRKALFSSIVTFLILGLLGSVFTIIFGIHYGDLTINVWIFFLFLFAVLGQQIMALIIALLRGQENHIFYNSTSVFSKFFFVGGAIIGILYFSVNPIEGYLLGTSIATFMLLFLLSLFFKLNQFWKMKLPSWENIKSMVSYGLPIIGIMLMGNLLPNFNRYVIFSDLGTVDVGKYVIGTMMAMLCLQILYEPLITVLHPRVFRLWENENKEEVRRIISNYLNIYIIIGLLVCGLSARHEEFLIKILANSSYSMPIGCFIILLLANFTLGIYRLVSIHFYLVKSTLELCVCFAISILASILTAFLLVGKAGLLGAAFSVLIGSIVLTATVWFRGRKNLKIRLIPKYHIIAFLLVIIYILSPLIFSSESPFIFGLIDASISLVITAGLGYLLINLYNKEYTLGKNKWRS